MPEYEDYEDAILERQEWMWEDDGPMFDVWDHNSDRNKEVPVVTYPPRTVDAEKYMKEHSITIEIDYMMIKHPSHPGMTGKVVHFGWGSRRLCKVCWRQCSTCTDALRHLANLYQQRDVEVRWFLPDFAATYDLVTYFLF